MKIDTSRTVLLLTLLLQLIALPPVFLAKLDHDALMRHLGHRLRSGAYSFRTNFANGGNGLLDGAADGVSNRCSDPPQMPQQRARTSIRECRP